MSKVLGILVVVLGIWISGEIYTKGTANAFGGLLVSTGLAEADAGPRHDPGRRAGAKVVDAHAEADARRNRLLAE